MRLLVRDIMRRGLMTCPPEATLGQAATLLARHRVHALLVAGPDGAPLGILSDMDLLAGEWLSADPDSLATLRRMTAGELMSAPPATIEAAAPAGEAASRMLAGRLHRLIVTEEGRAVGVISVSDLVAGLADVPAGGRTVAEVMSRGIVVCRENTRLKDAARAMIERHSRSVVVLSAGGKLKGVVTGLDLLAFCADGCDDETIVTPIMHPPLTIAPTASLREAADRMIHHHVHRLLVVNPAEPDSMPLGLISTSDIVAEMARPGSVWQGEE